MEGGRKKWDWPSWRFAGGRKVLWVLFKLRFGVILGFEAATEDVRGERLRASREDAARARNRKWVFFCWVMHFAELLLKSSGITGGAAS